MTITGTLVTIGKFLRTTGGHSMVIAGVLLKKTVKAVGGYSIVITGNPGKLIQITVGVGSVAITGLLSRIKITFGVVGTRSKWLLNYLLRRD